MATVVAGPLAGVPLLVATLGGLSVVASGGIKRVGELALLSGLYRLGEKMGRAG
jgi:hypothetical protein